MDIKFLIKSILLCKMAKIIKNLIYRLKLNYVRLRIYYNQYKKLLKDAILRTFPRQKREKN